MKTTGRRMTKAAAVVAVAEILAKLPEGMDLESVVEKAIDQAMYARAVKRAVADWPVYNAELAEEGAAALTWEQYIEFAKAEYWQDHWSTPPHPVA